MFNVVLLGKDCPLSKCCKMTVYFQITKDIGGKVICMENLCALNPLDHFFIDIDLVKTLFYDYQITNNITATSNEGYDAGESHDVMKPIAPREIISNK